MKSEDITKVRKKCGLSISMFANMLGVTYMTVSKWEKGETSPKLSHRILLRLAEGNVGRSMLREASRQVRQDMFDEELYAQENSEEVTNG